MESFFSNALGEPHEYRAGFTDKAGLVWSAKFGKGGGDLHCRPQGDSGPYVEVFHTRPQIKQVLLDMDAAEMKS